MVKGVKAPLLQWFFPLEEPVQVDLASRRCVKTYEEKDTQHFCEKTQEMWAFVLIFAFSVGASEPPNSTAEVIARAKLMVSSSTWKLVVCDVAAPEWLILGAFKNNTELPQQLGLFLFPQAPSVVG